MAKPSKQKVASAYKEMQEIDSQLKILQSRQRELRTRISESFQETQDQEGTQSVNAHGFEIKITRSISRSLTQEQLQSLEEDYPEVYAEAIVHKASLVTSKYRKHSDILDGYVVAKPGLPKVTITPIV